MLITVDCLGKAKDSVSAAMARYATQVKESFGEGIGNIARFGVVVPVTELMRDNSTQRLYETGHIVLKDVPQSLVNYYFSNFGESTIEALGYLNESGSQIICDIGTFVL